MQKFISPFTFLLYRLCLPIFFRDIACEVVLSGAYYKGLITKERKKNQTPPSNEHMYGGSEMK